VAGFFIAGLVASKATAAERRLSLQPKAFDNAQGFVDG
jgi:hypothetical protein